MQVVIGLEVHAQLLTRTKLFCGCLNRAGQAPNTDVCPVCLGLPGALPVANAAAFEYGLALGLALDCAINPLNRFARKNYFYPDLPKGYQITQHEGPLAAGGSLAIAVEGLEKTVRIQRIHVEDDAGKSVHAGEISLIDFNRAGVPLLEIVSEPDLTSPEEAAAYLKELRRLLMYLGICDGNMEDGSLRCDANISLREDASAPLGVRAEIKNLNSFKHVQRALNYEIERQTAVLAAGGQIVQETRLFDEASGETRPMRLKEQSHDYRYFPEPDLLPVALDAAWIERVRAALPELPWQRQARFERELGLSATAAEIITQSRPLADYFEQTLAEGAAAKEIANWVMTEVLRLIKDPQRELASFRVTPARLAELIKLVQTGTVSVTAAKEIFNRIAEAGGEPAALVEELGLSQLSSTDELKVLAAEVIAAHPREAATYRGGKAGLLGFFVGKLMQRSAGRANPKLAGEIIKELLEQ
ncbi:MAG: Aspartyl/glutamyl-tRNA(Asn/Gln) amidotransferase subunit B [Deltaproteobacteria bacterium ADurb.Bin510]|nr:MAG: Aspartyl/glutamyl-tRNA(Asn/Gln) amidotransferase subunit B [Deltaproteobacteria bacterium ADurb.Bin510]